MAQISFTQIDNTWYEFTPTAGTTYRIQNRGARPFVAQEADAEPQAGDVSGILVAPGKTLVYEKGSASALYIRTLEGVSTINVTTEA